MNNVPDLVNTPPIIRFKPDASLRRQLMVPEAMTFPAKAHLGMMLEIFQRYTQPGDWVLDPFGGIGGSLVGCLTGRHVILIEKEAHWVEIARASYEKMQIVGPMVGYTMGEALIHQGDSRVLTAFTGLGQDVGHIVTSPPDETVANASKNTNTNDAARGYPTKPMAYTPVDAVITSPPYEEAQSGGGISKKGHYKDPGLAKRVYSDRVMAGIEAVITSPPYEEGLGHGLSALGKKKAVANASGQRAYTGDRTALANIGNLRGPAFWEACAQVFQECRQVLKPNGSLVLISKGFTRDKAYVDLPGQFQALLEGMGFVVCDHWRRQLWNRSFWRTLQRKKDPESWDDRLDYEEVMAFRREEI